MEPTGAEVLSAEWAAVERKLRRRLRALPLGPADVDDVCQDTFVRLLRRADRLEPTHVLPLALVAGWNLGLNALRDRATRAVPTEDFPELVSGVGVDQEAQWRLELERTLDVVTTMSPADQAAVLRHLFGERGVDKRDQDRQALRLLRARARLRAKLGSVLAGLPIWRWRLFSPEALQAASAVAFSALVVGAASFGGSTGSSAIATSLSPSRTVRAPSPIEHPPGATSGSGRSQATSVTEHQPPREAAVRLPAEPARQPVMRIEAPATGSGGGVDTGGRGDRPNLACVSAPHLGTTCVPHPLRP